MPSTGQRKADQQRRRNARRAAERAAADDLRERVSELEGRVKRAEEDKEDAERMARNYRDSATHESRENDRLSEEIKQLEEKITHSRTVLFQEVERLSSLTFPMTVYPPPYENRRSAHTIQSAAELVELIERNAPEAAWDRSPTVAERRRGRRRSAGFAGFSLTTMDDKPGA